MIRPPNGRDYEDSCLAGLVPADTGVRGDCSHVLSLEDAASLVMDANPGMRSGSQDSRSRSLYLLSAGILSGDLLIVPLRGRRSSLFAIARPETGVACGFPARRIEILREVSGALPADIENSLKAHACVCEVRARDGVSRFRAIVSGEDVTVTSDGCPWSGHEFAGVVANILTSDGFSCRVSPAGPDGGVDIRAGRGVLGTGDATIVQVKATSTPVGVSEVQRLLGIISARGARGLIVSWGGLTAQAIACANDAWPLVSFWDREAFLERHSRTLLPGGSGTDG